MEKKFTEEEVKQMLTAVFIFACSNDEQGIMSIIGKNFEDKIKTVIDAFEEVKKSGKSIISMPMMLGNN